MKILPRKTSLACLLALVAFAPSGFSQTTDDLSRWEDDLRWERDLFISPNCTWVRNSENRWVELCWAGFGPSRMFRAQDSCGNESLFVINDGNGELLAQHALEPGEELEEVVNVTSSEVTLRLKSSNTDTLLAQFQTFLAQDPTWGQLGEGVMEAQVVTASSHFPELQFGTPSRAAAFDRWYEEVYAGSSTEPSEILRTYRIVKAEKALQMTQERVFGAGDAEQLVDDASEAPSERRLMRNYYTAKVSDDGTTLKLRRYAYKTAQRVPVR
ncbi:MAG: hypothetical protein JHD33_08630 [Chthoniobacterales bacterium]|nr:hypothetical protein [Chthoniobacterales bacterium]